MIVLQLHFILTLKGILVLPEHEAEFDCISSDGSRPSCPFWWLPKVKTSPSKARTTEWWPPAAIETALFGIGMWVGLPRGMRSI